jgi:RNA recognition motif-containing protein
MADTDTRKLFVAGLSEGITEVELRQLVEETGASVEDIAVPRDRQTGHARGFGFITLTSEADAERVREALDGSLQSGRPISVRPFRGNRPESRPPRIGGEPPPRERDDRESTLFLASLPNDCTDEEIRGVFEQAEVGPIVKLHLPVDPDGQRRGFGFVSLADADQARDAVAKLREHSLRGRPLTVDVARPRGERPERSPGPPGAAGGAWRGQPPPARRPGGDAGPGGPPRSFPSGDGGGGGSAPTERQTWDERRVVGKRKKETKKKKVRQTDRGRSRRDGEGFRAPRARGYMDDWEKD